MLVHRVEGRLVCDHSCERDAMVGSSNVLGIVASFGVSTPRGEDAGS